MAMSDKRILEAKDKGQILIEPFNRNQLATASYDVRLGENFYREQRPSLDANIFNIFDPEHVKKVWGEPVVAPFARDILPKDTYSGINPEDRVILLAPGETILAHTDEFIGGRETITSMMKARSSMGRSFVLVCKCAGLGDIGYQNRWTMEVTNVSRFYSIPLLVGCRVAQIVFFEAGPILDKDYTQTGNYQTTSDIEELKKNWTPDSMLPKVRK